MDNKELLQRAMDVMGEVGKISNELNRLTNLTDAHTGLWANAVQIKDGVQEQEQRVIIHSLMDQMLDARARSLQLVNELHSLPKPTI